MIILNKFSAYLRLRARLIPSHILLLYAVQIFLNFPTVLASPRDQLVDIPRYKEAYAKLNSRDYVGALSLFEELLSISNESAGVHYGLARSQQELGRNKDALESYNNSIRLDPSNAKAYSNRGLIQGALGNLKSALEDFDTAIRIDPQFAFAYSNRGVSRGALGDLRGAINDFTKAIELDKRYGAAWRNRGISREILGDINGACEDWKTAATLGQSDVKAWVINQCPKEGILKQSKDARQLPGIR